MKIEIENYQKTYYVYMIKGTITKWSILVLLQIYYVE